MLSEIKKSEFNLFVEFLRDSGWNILGPDKYESCNIGRPNIKHVKHSVRNVDYYGIDAFHSYVNSNKNIFKDEIKDFKNRSLTSDISIKTLTSDYVDIIFSYLRNIVYLNNRKEINKDLHMLLNEETPFDDLVCIYNKYKELGYTTKPRLIVYLDTQGNGVTELRKTLKTLKPKAIKNLSLIKRKLHLNINDNEVENAQFNDMSVMQNEWNNLKNISDVEDEFIKFKTDMGLPIKEMSKKLEMWQKKYTSCSSLADIRIAILENNAEEQIKRIIAIQNYLFNIPI